MVLHINVQGKIKKTLKNLKKNIQRHVLLKNKKKSFKNRFYNHGAYLYFFESGENWKRGSQTNLYQLSYV